MCYQELLAFCKSMKEDLIDNTNIQEENTLKFTGQQEEQAKEMSFLGNALMIAVFLIFLIFLGSPGWNDRLI